MKCSFIQIFTLCLILKFKQSSLLGFELQKNELQPLTLLGLLKVSLLHSFFSRFLNCFSLSITYYLQPELQLKNLYGIILVLQKRELKKVLREKSITVRCEIPSTLPLIWGVAVCFKIFRSKQPFYFSKLIPKISSYCTRNKSQILLFKI